MVRMLIVDWSDWRVGKRSIAAVSVASRSQSCMRADDILMQKASQQIAEVSKYALDRNNQRRPSVYNRSRTYMKTRLPGSASFTLSNMCYSGKQLVRIKWLL